MAAARSNVDLLGWFPGEERETCGSCGIQALVSVPEALASFCFSCGAVWLEGERLDLNDRIAFAAHSSAPPGQPGTETALDE